ncbi:MAG: BTH_I0359 family protein, partial [Giesbergeria sp.]
MNMLYDSDSFVVVHMLPDADLVLGQAQENPKPQLMRHGFEIVDKRTGKEVYLDGSWAEMFQMQILAWQRNAP